MSIKLERLQSILTTNGQDGQLFVAKDGRAVSANKTQKEGLFCLQKVAPASFNKQLKQYNLGIQRLISEEQYHQKLSKLQPKVIPQEILNDFGPNAQNYVVFEDSRNWNEF